MKSIAGQINESQKSVVLWWDMNEEHPFYVFHFTNAMNLCLLSGPLFLFIETGFALFIQRYCS